MIDTPNTYESRNGMLRICYGDWWDRGFTIYMSLPPPDEIAEKKFLPGDLAAAKAQGLQMLELIEKKLADAGYPCKKDAAGNLEWGARFERTPHVTDIIPVNTKPIYDDIEAFQIAFRDAYEAVLRENKAIAAYMGTGQRNQLGTP